MIFVTVGSQKFQFDRLLKKLDELIAAGVITEPVFAQIGECKYQPQHFESTAFLDRDLFKQKVAQSDVVVTHGGTGAIISAIKAGKKVVAVARLARYGEHVDDHQLQILEQFAGMGILSACVDVEQLADCLAQVQTIQMQPYQSNTARIIQSITQFLEIS